MRVLLFIILPLLFLPVKSVSQVNIGDLELDSFESFFNPDNRYWGKKTMGVYKFNGETSEIWINSPMTGYIPKSKYIKKEQINLQVDESYEQSEIHKKLIHQFGEQFGEYEEITINTPVIQGTGGESDYLKWTYNEKGGEFQVLLGSFGTFTIVSISKLKEIPDF